MNWILFVPMMLLSCSASAQKEDLYLRGKALYTTHCAVCHQPDGDGVPRLNPPLSGSKVLLGASILPIQIVLKGSDAKYSREENWNNQMPSMAHLKDSEIGAILSYVRKAFGNKAPVITAREVAAARSRK